MNIELERKAFEHWFSDGDLGCKSIERSGESYLMMATHQAWKVWQARAGIQDHMGEYICGKCGLRQSLNIKPEADF